MHLTSKISLNPFPGLRMKTFSVMLACGLLCSPNVLAQMHDDFSDGDLSALPLWQGMTDDFVVNQSLQLQLNASTAGTSWLSTTFSSPNGSDVSWEFWL